LRFQAHGDILSFGFSCPYYAAFGAGSPAVSCKLECLSIKRHLNHFVLRAQLYLKAIRVAYDELQTLKAA